MLSRDKRYIRVSSEKIEKFIEWLIHRYRLPMVRDTKHVGKEVECCLARAKVRAGWHGNYGYIAFVDVIESEDGYEGSALLAVTYTQVTDRRGRTRSCTYFTNRKCVLENCHYPRVIARFLFWAALRPLIKINEESILFSTDKLILEDDYGSKLTIMEHGRFVKGSEAKLWDFVAQAKAKQFYERM